MERIERLNLRSYTLRMMALLSITVIAIFIGLGIGSVKIGINDLITTLFSANADSTLSQIIFEIRLPRILFAVAVGGGLSIAGAVFQAILLNPFAEPYILGISSGGTFSAVLSFLIWVPFIGTQLFSFAGALIVMMLVFYSWKKIWRT